MSVSGISSTSFYSYGAQNRIQQFQQDFQQLGQDLQAGNLSAAQSDFASIQQLQTGSSSTASTSSSQSTNPVTQAFSQLSQDLQSGNLSAAQQDYTTIQQDLQNQGTQAHHHHHHHHHHAESSNGSSGSDSNTISQEFTQLGQALQSGNLTSAQQAYSTLQQDFQQFAISNGAFSSSWSGSSSSSSLSISG